MRVKMELLLSTIIALYAVVVFPSGYLLLTAILTVAAYLFTKSYFSVLGVLIVMVLLNALNAVFLTTVESNKYGAITGPTGGTIVGVEAFQPKDPVSIHQRLSSDKRGLPLQPKVNQVQGVLEAPSILNSLQISQIDSFENGASSKALPATVGVTERIRTPAEGFVPNVPSPDLGAPRGNPFLHNGEDKEGVKRALEKTLLTGEMHEEAGATVGPGAPV
uniref:Uncharacterized protein n=1 Tax=viral metagenome TaxID=1070528 RepID=A0A6C0K4K3_9ZZZZ